MAGTFTQRIDELEKRLGEGTLTGSVTVDQVYAAFQHNHLELHHPRGGSGGYLTRPLMAHFRDYLTDYAKTVLSDGGQAAMKRSMEHLCDEVETTAPREWGDLMKSGHPKVTQGGRTLYDRAPKAARLSKEELRAKSRAILRSGSPRGSRVYFFKHGKLMRIPGKNEPHGLRGRL